MKANVCLCVAGIHLISKSEIGLYMQGSFCGGAVTHQPKCSLLALNLLKCASTVKSYKCHVQLPQDGGYLE